MDVQRGIDEFHQAEKDIQVIVNGADGGEAQQALSANVDGGGFDLSDFLDSSSMYTIHLSLAHFFL